MNADVKMHLQHTDKNLVDIDTSSDEEKNTEHKHCKSKINTQDSINGILYD